MDFLPTSLESGDRHCDEPVGTVRFSTPIADVIVGCLSGGGVDVDVAKRQCWAMLARR